MPQPAAEVFDLGQQFAPCHRLTPAPGLGQTGTNSEQNNFRASQLMSFRRTAADLDRLRARIAAIEGLGGDAATGCAVPLGAKRVDRALPWGGLVRGALHEVIDGGAGVGAGPGAADGFAALLLARLAAPAGSAPAGFAPAGSAPAGFGRPALWVSRGGDLYAPGLFAFGLDPGDLVVARARTDAEALWAIEEGLRSPALAAVLGEVHTIDFAASRRLQLAAASTGVTALLRRPGRAPLPASAAATRWRIAPGPAPGGDGRFVSALGPARWRVALLRCRGGSPKDWLLEWDDAAGDLAVVAETGNRQDRQDAA